MDLSIIQALKETTESIRDWAEDKLEDKAAADHKHDNDYATKDHDHHGVYAFEAHNHDDKYDIKDTASSTVSNHNVSLSAHNDIRQLIIDLTDRLNALADSDDATLDQLSEIVAYIKSNKDLIDGVTASKVNVADIIDNLETNVTDKPLSAAQGVAIKALIDDLDLALNAHDGDTAKHITSAERTNWNAAYTHSQAAHAPSDAQKNQNAFSNIAVSGQTTVAADTATDTVTFVGSNVSITTDADNDKVTFSVSDGTTSAKGIVKLSDSTSSTSTTTAATSNSVKVAYDLAAGKVDKEDGKGLSTNDYTTEEKIKLSDLGKKLDINMYGAAPLRYQYDGTTDVSIDVSIPGHKHNLSNDISGGVLPIESGGTKAKTAAEARQNLNYIGRNPVTSDTDTPTTWAGLGTGFAYIDSQGRITDQPSTNGFIENFVTEKGGIRQIWHSHTTAGTIYKRAGNTTNGWFSTSWTKVFDSTDTVPIVNGGTEASTLLEAANNLGFPSFYKATAIPENSDLNDFQTFGNYKCTIPATSKTFTNCPTQKSFRMYVYSPAPDVSGYIAQDVYELVSGTRFYRYFYTNTDGSTGWTKWVKTFNSNGIIPSENGGMGSDSSVEIGITMHLRKCKRFVSEMNVVAQNIGMNNSFFKTASGLCGRMAHYNASYYGQSYNSYTTAYDLLRLLIAARHTPAVLSAMSTISYTYTRNSERATAYHSVLAHSGWTKWASDNGYTMIAAKGGSLDGEYGQIGNNGIYNMAMLIKNNKDGKIYGLAVVGLENSDDAQDRASAIMHELIQLRRKDASDTYTTSSTNEIDKVKGGSYPAGMMVVELTANGTFADDISRLDSSNPSYTKGYNTDKVRVSASVAKILNAITAVPYLDNHYCAVSYNDLVGGSDKNFTKSNGDVFSTYDALHIMMMRSDNAMATLLARDCGSRMDNQYMGTNIIPLTYDETYDEKDDVAAWIAFGNGHVFVNSSAKIKERPISENGDVVTANSLIISTVTGDVINQEWHTLNGAHRVYYRSGSETNGWYKRSGQENSWIWQGTILQEWVSTQINDLKTWVADQLK